MTIWRLMDFSSCNIQQEPPAMLVAYLHLLFFNWLISGLFYTDIRVVDLYEPVGCFNDQRNPRALPKFIKYYPVNETDLANSLASIIQKCATEVFKKGFWYFGVEYRHECWSGVNSSLTYNRHGRSNSCLWDHGHGSACTIFVYRFVEG